MSCPSNSRSGTFKLGQLWEHVSLWNWVRNHLWYSGYFRFSSRLELDIDFSLFFRGYRSLYGEPEMEVIHASWRLWGLRALNGTGGVIGETFSYAPNCPISLVTWVWLCLVYLS